VLIAVAICSTSLLSQVLPVFQFAIFYNTDMEICPGANMTVNGDVFCNGTIWADPAGILTFEDKVETTATNIFYTRSPNDQQSSTPNPTVVYLDPLSPVLNVSPFPLILPAGTNYTTNAAVILDLPPSGIDPNSPVGQIYLYNEADIIISNSSSGTISAFYQNSNNVNQLTTIPYNATNVVSGVTNKYYSFATNVSFYDYRESDTVKAVQINVAAFNSWLSSSGATYNNQNNSGSTSKGHYINSIYVYNSVPLSSSQLPAVRMANGGTLPAQGLTVATPFPIYVLGNYNANGSSLNNGTNVVNAVPAGLMADSITVLSTTWSDSYNSSTALSSRNAGNTTVNAATLEGIVPSATVNGIKHYSGGVENFLRLLEDWTGDTLTYNGSIIVLFQSRFATNFWQTPGNYYDIPTRAWAFDVNFLTQNGLPPLTPAVVNPTNPPSITQQPQNQVVPISSNATFTVAAFGTTPISYQWYFSNSNLQTTASAYAQMLFGFVYGVFVTNAGSGYTTIPQVNFIGGGGSGAAGTAVVSDGMVTAITVTNAGSGYTNPPMVQIDPPNGFLIGQTNTTLDLNAVTTNNAGNYSVVLSNTYGSVTSSVASLAVVPILVTQQPASQIITNGGTAVFSVSASGPGPFSYQWLFNGNNLASTNLPTLTLANVTTNDIGSYSVIISSPLDSVTSSVAVLNMPVYIAMQPLDQNALLGGSFSFAVASGGTAPLSYQWAFDGTNLTGATNADYTVNNAATNDTGLYSVTVTNLFGSTASSNAALTVAYITLQPMSQVVVSGETASFNVALSTTGVFSYQWQFNGANLPNATSVNYTIGSAGTNDAGNYSVLISNSSGSITSSVANLTVVCGPTIVQQPQSVNVALGNNAAFNVTASGTAPLSYQWWTVSGTQSNVAAEPFVTNGFVLAANMTSGGAGYLAVPQVLFVGGSGSGASGYAVVSNQMVTAIVVTNAGFGYTTTPTIQIGAPSSISVSSQTSTNLILLAVANSNAGNYFVVVTNDFGGVTSSLAALTVFLPPQNFSASSINGQQLTLQLTGTPGYPYILQSATNLTPPVNWQSILTNPADVNGNWSFVVTNTTTVPANFFRAVGQ